MDYESTQRPVRLVSRTARLLLRYEEERLKTLGLATAQVPVLLALKNGASLTQKDLARLSHTGQPTMALLLVRMERDGLIRRTSNLNDGRSQLISLTPLAQSKLPKAEAILARGDKASLRGFSDREQATLARLLRRVITNLDPRARVIGPGQS